MSRAATAMLIIIGISLVLCEANLAVNAQTPPPQNRQRKVPPEPVEKKAETAPSPEPNEAELAMRLAMTDLANQIALLTDEVKRLRQQTGRSSTMLELLISEERLGRIEDKLQDVAERKAQLDGREQDLQRRSRNIQQELILRGGIRRDEAEAAIRADLQRSLDDVHAQQSTYQQRLTELQAQAERLRSRVAGLRQRVEASDEKEVPKVKQND